MPTIEFFGYSNEETSSMIELAKQSFQDLPFKETIVFVKMKPSSVIGWDNKEYPFIRISTRSQERAHLLQSRLHEYADVEIVHIDFQPRKKMP
jgi:hypothetical protein